MGQYNPFEGYRITSGYGWRALNDVKEFHTGIDLVKGERGEKSPLPAFVAGRVTWAKWGSTGTGYGNYGNVVAIRDKYGFTHVYAHLDYIAVKETKTVLKGQIVGRQGTTGKSTGVHLHYEVRREGWGTHVNPTEYLKKVRGEELKMIFTDMEGHWARAEVEKAYNLGIVAGRKPGIYDPNTPVTRAELAVVAMRLYEKLK
jgi:murein DD-endopeptidase MepM/ murein hydrolase activator NlpD